MVGNTMILAAQTEGLSRLFDLDFQLLADAVLMIIAMFFLFLFASHFLFNPVRKMLQDRQAKIKGELDQAASDQKSAAEARALYEDKLKQVGKEAEEFWQMPASVVWQTKQRLLLRQRTKLQRL